jgi:hypothetical protein
MADGLLRAMIASKKDPSDGRLRAKERSHTKEFDVTLRIKANGAASSADIRDYLHDLEWAGGCRHPDDPLFTSVTLAVVKVSQPQRKKKGG